MAPSNPSGQMPQPLDLTDLPEDPLVSVIMGNYNYESYVGEAIESVLNQTNGMFELIVCDDGSTDGSCDVIERYSRADPRVKFLRKANGGQASAWNAAYALSCGPILCTMDSDDLFHPNKLEAVVRHFKARTDSGFAIHPMMVIDKAGEEIQRVPYLTRFEEGWIADRIVARGGRWPFMPSSALCFRRDLGASLFPIPEPLFRLCADAFVFTLAPMLTSVSIIDEILTGYRVHGLNGMSTNQIDDATARREVDFIRRTHVGVNARLNEMGYDGPILRSDSNLDFVLNMFIISLFDDVSPLRLSGQFSHVLSRLLRDDLYSLPQKWLGVAVYGVAIMLPSSYRSRWLTKALRPNRTKALIKGAVGYFRRALRRRPGEFMRSPSRSRPAAGTPGRFRWGPVGRMCPPYSPLEAEGDA